MKSLHRCAAIATGAISLIPDVFAGGGKYEGLLPQVLMANAAGECPAALMRDELRKSYESQLPDLKDKFANLGPFKGISLQSTRPLEGGAAEVYKVTFEHGDWTWVLNAG